MTYEYKGNGELHLWGKGVDIESNTIQFTWYDKKEILTNFEQIAFVASQEQTDTFAKAGVGVWNSNPTIGSGMGIWLSVVPNGAILVQQKLATGGVTLINTVESKAVPLWLRVKKDGYNLSLYYSQQQEDALIINWILIQTINDFFVGFGDFYRGVFACAHHPTATSKVVFKHIFNQTSGAELPTPENFRRLFIFLGSSIMGGRAANSTAPSADIRTYSRVKILNNSTLSTEDLNIGVNSDLADNESIPNTHGLELRLAKAIEENVLGSNNAYLCKIAQGGALFGQFTEGLAYANSMIQRLDSIKAKIASDGFSPTPYIIIELELNDSANHEGLGQTKAKYKERLKSLIDRVRAKFSPTAQVILLKPWAIYGYYNDMLDELGNEDNYTHVISFESATKFDLYHPDYAGNQLIMNLVISAILGIEGATPELPDPESPGTGTNAIANITVPVADKYNKIMWDCVPDFTVPTFSTTNYPSGEPRKLIVFLGPRLTVPSEKLFKRGWTVSFNNLPAEVRSNDKPSNWESPLTRAKRGFYTTTGIFTNAPYSLNMDVSTPGDLNDDFYQDNGASSYQQAMQAFVGAAQYTFGGQGAYYMQLNWEKGWFDGSGGSTPQDFMNRVYAVHKFISDFTDGKTYFNTSYCSGGTQLSKTANDSSYDLGHSDSPAWSSFVAETSNSIAKKMPSNFQGKNLSDVPGVLKLTEIYMHAETFLAQGEKIKNRLGNFLPDINHFGPNTETNLVDHWAAQVGSICEIIKMNTPGNGKYIVQLGPFNYKGHGYVYDFANPDQYAWEKAKVGFFEKMPPLIAEGQILMALFSGANIVIWNNDANGMTELAFNAGDPTTSDGLVKDYSSYSYIMKAYRRFWAEKATVGGNEVAIGDLIDGNEVYLNNTLEVSYDNGATYTALRANRWKFDTKSPVRAIVNESQNKIAIYACQAYGVEQSAAFVRYNKNGFNFIKQIQIPVGVNSMYIYKLSESVN